MATLPDAPHAQQLIALFTQAQTDIERHVTRAVAAGAKGTARFYRAQLHQVHQRLIGLQQQVGPLVGHAVQGSYMTGVTLANAAIPKSMLLPSMAGIHDEAVSVLADNLANRLGASIQHIGRSAQDVFRQEQLKAAASGLITGAPRTETSEAMTANLQDQAVKAFTDRAGRQWQLAHYTKMAVRTVTREAVSHGTKNRLLEHGLDLVTIDEHGADDEACQPYEGNTYSLTGATGGYDVLDDMPPFHPNCIHVMTPAEDNFAALEASLA